MRTIHESLALIESAAQRTLIKDLTLQKAGVTIPKGTKVGIHWLQPHEGPWMSIVGIVVPGRDKKIPVMIQNLHKYVSGISKPPTVSRLTKMMDSGYATTPTGKRVEPDGTGPDGSPSWLLVLGYV